MSRSATDVARLTTKSRKFDTVGPGSLAALMPEQKEKFLPLCPDFVLELRSPTDGLTAVQAKMQEYLDNGARLGFLIDPEHKRVYVYRSQRPVEILQNPDTISGDPVLPGFILDLRPIW